MQICVIKASAMKSSNFISDQGNHRDRAASLKESSKVASSDQQIRRMLFALVGVGLINSLFMLHKISSDDESFSMEEKMAAISYKSSNPGPISKRQNSNRIAQYINELQAEGNLNLDYYHFDEGGGSVDESPIHDLPQQLMEFTAAKRQKDQVTHSVGSAFFWDFSMPSFIKNDVISLVSLDGLGVEHGSELSPNAGDEVDPRDIDDQGNIVIPDEILRSFEQRSNSNLLSTQQGKKLLVRSFSSTIASHEEPQLDDNLVESMKQTEAISRGPDEGEINIKTANELIEST